MATNVPEPVNTPYGPAYEGRILDRPEEEVVDQGASFDINSLMSRRLFLGASVVSLGSLALAACSTSTSSAGTASSASLLSSSSATTTLPAGEIPDEAAGPYPGDGSNGPDILEQSGIVRSNIRTSIGSTTEVEGVPLEFTLNIRDLANDDAPFTNAAVYAWHCNAKGEYSMYSSGVENEAWLRGVQVVDANGDVTFKSIVPACYSGRWPHIQFEVYPDVDSITDSNNAISVSQLAFPEEPLGAVYALDTYSGSTKNLANVSLATDNVFGDDGGELQIATVTGDVNSGYNARLVVRVDTTTERTAGSAPGGGAPGGPGNGQPMGPPPSN